MENPLDSAPQSLADAILPCQYNDLIRRPSAVAIGEYRLLWAILEDAIKTYVGNRNCSTAAQRRKFAEVREWFKPVRPSHGLFGFHNVCHLLGIDSARLLQGLKSLDGRGVIERRHPILSRARAQKLAA